jgi:hypothetical protein
MQYRPGFRRNLPYVNTRIEEEESKADSGIASDISDIGPTTATSFSISLLRKALRTYRCNCDRSTDTRSRDVQTTGQSLR